MQPLSLYIHIPWCIKKCPYCDFNSHAISKDTPESGYIDALLCDLSHDIRRFNIDRPIHSMFIGGGTPSLFSPEAFERLFAGIKQRLCLQDNLEITLEANPGTFESEKFAAFKALGINRLSIGIQSFNDDQLQRLGRIHSGLEAIKAVEMAHRTGFTNFNLDLMFGLPEIGGHSSYADLATAIQLAPSHISFYQLTLEPNTYFHKFPPQLPDDECIFTSQQACSQLLVQNGYQQYEISAYSLPGSECQHNLNYWRFGDYLGIGAGAHGKIGTPSAMLRTTKVKSPERYLQQPCHNDATEIATDALPLEFVMNRLRLKSGFTLQHYRAATGLDPATLEPALSQCLALELLVYQDQHYRCSEQGWYFLDSILEKFIH